MSYKNQKCSRDFCVVITINVIFLSSFTKSLENVIFKLKNELIDKFLERHFYYYNFFHLLCDK